jgi:hypothetical protein
LIPGYLRKACCLLGWVKFINENRGCGYLLNKVLSVLYCCSKFYSYRFYTFLKFIQLIFCVFGNYYKWGLPFLSSVVVNCVNESCEFLKSSFYYFLKLIQYYKLLRVSSLPLSTNAIYLKILKTKHFVPKVLFKWYLRMSYEFITVHLL